MTNNRVCCLYRVSTDRSGESRSDQIPELEIVTPEQFQTAQELSRARSQKALEERTVPFRTSGQTLLSGNIFCGHCGARLFETTNGKYTRRVNGTVDTTKRVRYYCYGKVKKQTGCTGQTGYTAHILDDLIDKLVREVFSKMKGLSKEDLVHARYERELDTRKKHLTMMKSDYCKAVNTVSLLKDEVLRCIKGESGFSREMLAGMIQEAESKCNELQQLVHEAEEELQGKEIFLKQMNRQYDELISWADIYSGADLETKKMIVNSMIKRIEVSRDYKLKVEFHLTVDQFLNGLDCSA